MARVLLHEDDNNWMYALCCNTIDPNRLALSPGIVRRSHFYLPVQAPKSVCFFDVILIIIKNLQSFFIAPTALGSIEQNRQQF